MIPASVERSIVEVLSETDATLGTGSIVSADGLVLTAKHVRNGRTQVRIRYGSAVYDATHVESGADADWSCAVEAVYTQLATLGTQFAPRDRARAVLRRVRVTAFILAAPRPDVISALRSELPELGLVFLTRAQLAAGSLADIVHVAPPATEDEELWAEVPRLLHDVNLGAPFNVHLGLETTDEMCLADLGVVTPTHG